MRAGNMRERVTIQEQIVTDNGQGGEVAVWQDVIGANGQPLTVFAEITGLAGQEILKQSSIERSIVQWKVRIRKGTGVTAQHRLLWKDRTLNILGVMDDPIERQVLDFLHCQSGD